MTDCISTDRLDLVSFRADFLRMSLAGNVAAAERMVGLAIPAEWFQQGEYIALRLGQMEVDAGLETWLVRGMGLRATREMVGYLGFHTGPAPEYLRELSPGGVEFGYTVFEAFRRQGFGREAVVGLMEWARGEHGVERFVVSISPDNVGSLKLAERLGFRRIGSHIDETDGYEDIFELRVS